MNLQAEDSTLGDIDVSLGKVGCQVPVDPELYAETVAAYYVVVPLARFDDFFNLSWGT